MPKKCFYLEIWSSLIITAWHLCLKRVIFVPLEMWGALVLSDKTNVTKKLHFFFFCVLQLMTVLLLICNSYASWSTCFISLKPVVGFRIFDSISFLLNFTFCSTKSMSSLTLKRQNSSHKRATHSFAPRPLIFKLQLVIWKLIDICMSWSSAKSDLERNFLNIKNRSFRYVSFSQ